MDLDLVVSIVGEVLAEALRGRSGKGAIAEVLRRAPRGYLREKALAVKLAVETMRRLGVLEKAVQQLDAELRVERLPRPVYGALLALTFRVLFEKADRMEVARWAWAMRRVFGFPKVHPVEYVLAQLGVVEVQCPEDDEGLVAWRLGYPRWVVRLLFREFGRHFALKLLEAGNWEPITYLRVNTLRTTVEEAADALDAEGFQIKELRYPPYVLLLRRSKEGKPVLLSKAYRQGWVVSQDLGSCLVVEAAHPTPDERVLDLCAAPGMKTTLLAQHMKNRGVIISVDRSFRRMVLWREMVWRLGVEIAEPLVADAVQPLPLTQQFDLVLVDPPCTSMGAFWRDPMMKWRLRPRLLRTYFRLQLAMLKQAACYVGEGGRIVYAVCTYPFEEAEKVVEEFLATHPGFRLEHPEIPGSSGCREMREAVRLYTHQHRCNGYFIAVLRR